MKVGYQGEELSYSHGAVRDLFPDAEPVGIASFAAAFHALENHEVEKLVLPIENSTTGSVLPVLDRLVTTRATITGEHLVEIRHALFGAPDATLDDIKTVRSHPEALGQAEELLLERGWEAIPTHDTAGAVREVAAAADPSEAALAPSGAGAPHGLKVLLTPVIDRHHNTTRFVVLSLDDHTVADSDDKTSIVFETRHQPGALALALTELGLRGANLTRIESRPSEKAWVYRFFVDLVHLPGRQGLEAILEPPPATMVNLQMLGSYPSAPV